MLEELSQKGLIDLFYGDESHVSSQGYVPYGWQFPDENVSILVEKGYKINCFGMINRKNEFHWATSSKNINASFVLDFLEELSFNIKKETFIVLDNAPVHSAKIIQERIQYWEKRGLYIFFLPPYSPHLNIVETVWRKMKTQWIDPEHYQDKDTLAYALNPFFANLGKNITINFSDFNLN